MFYARDRVGGRTLAEQLRIHSSAARDSLLARLRAVLSAYAHVVFATDPRVGALVFAGSCIDLRRGAYGLLSVCFTQLLVERFSLVRCPVRMGWYSYSGLLAALSLPALPWAAAATLILLSASLALAATEAIDQLLRGRGLPVLALPFVLVAGPIGFALNNLSQNLWDPTATLAAFDLNPAELGVLGSTNLESQASELATNVRRFFRSLSEGLAPYGALVWNPSPWAGIPVALGLFIHSRVVFSLTLLGTLLGRYASTHLFHETNEWLVLSAEYNCCLSMAALGAVFAIPSRLSWGFSIFAGLVTVTLDWLLHLQFSVWQWPVLAWPFALGTLLLLPLRRLLDKHWTAPILQELAPEKGYAWLQSLAVRGEHSLSPQFRLPIAGSWVVTQGVNGGITHRGALAFALDFEVLDENGFPFLDHGQDFSDYPSFGKPVLSPGFGTVVAALDSQQDNQPGTENRAAPWGNFVTLQHGIGLYSVLAHHRQGSLQVQLGQQVVPGQVMAEVGASGRSPRPHLHFQAQHSAELGSATLPFTLLDYVVEAEGSREFFRRGTPAEGERVTAFYHPTPTHLPIMGALSTAAPLCTALGAQHTLRVAVTATGERYVYDTTTYDALFYRTTPVGVVFVSVAAKLASPLGCLALIAPFLPDAALVRNGPVRCTETIPGEWLQSAAQRLGSELTLGLGRSTPLQVHMEILLKPDGLVVQSQIVQCGAPRTRMLASGHVRIDTLGIAELAFQSPSHGINIQFARASVQAAIASEKAVYL